MSKWIITTESGSDISMEEAASLGIGVIPMHVMMDGKSYDDGTFPAEDICEYYNKTKKVPQTSGCSPDDFMRFFAKIKEENPGANIIHLAYSGVTTVSYASACLASEGDDSIVIADTKHVSAGLRCVVLHTLDVIKREPDISREKLLTAVYKIRNITKMCFVPETLAYLHAGGRCGNLAYIGGKLLNLHPCVDIQDGKLIATKKYRGGFKKVIPELISDYTKKYALDKGKLWFVAAPGFTPEMKHVAETAARECGYLNISWVKTGCVITSHGGAGAFGIIGLTQPLD